jgi:homoserine dehydrogenase
MNRKKLTIGLFGFGCVGNGLYEVLKRTPGLRTGIKTIVVKNKDKPRPLGPEYFSYQRNDILEDPEINVVVELIDDADAAFEIVSQALRKGKAVVTANKKMIAEHFTELLDLQKEHNVPLLYEAACCASIPIIRNLEEYYDNDLLESLEGIVNGSTNYILTKTSKENITYEEALKNAQEQGYAESDPSLDTGGFDAKYKLLILLAHAFGIVAKPADIFNAGIDRLGDPELAYAREKGLKIKLVAHAFKNSAGRINSFVLPQFVGTGSKLHSVDDVFNGVITKTSFADIQFFSGKGAGAYPTASAVLSDLSALTYDYRYEYKKLTRDEQLENESAIFLKVFFRFNLSHKLDYGSFFEHVDESYTGRDHAYLTGIISLRNLRSVHESWKGNSFILIEPVEEYLTKEKNKLTSYEFTE